MDPQGLTRLAISVQPLVFETGIADTPYSTAGTVFLVGYKGRAFVITARHSLRPEQSIAICVFPSDTSQRLLPLKDVFFVPREFVDEDFVDLAVVEIDITRINDNELGQARLIDLALASGDWMSRHQTAEMIVLGYPEEYSFVNYDSEMLVNRRFILQARYVGPSSQRHLHEIEVVDTQSLSTFSGFSGAPVFAWFQCEYGHRS